MIFIYLLLTAGVYMFLESSSNSYNRMRMAEKKITPASIVISENKASLSVLDSKASFSTEIFSPESTLYVMAYLFSPDDIKLVSYGVRKNFFLKTS